jgi:hypothetical protein
MKIKRFIAALLCAVTVTALLAVPVSAEWVKEDGKTYWTDEDGAKAKGFEVIDGSTYYFKSADGSMATGWMKIGGKYYYFSKSSGKMLAGNTYKIGGKLYKFDKDGVWDGSTGTTASATTGTSASKGFKKGVWGEKMSVTEKRVGDTWIGLLEGEEVSVGMDMDLGWTKYGDSKAIASMDMYLYYENSLIAAATAYAGTVPAKDGKPTSEDLTELTKAQIDALAKSLSAKAEKNVGKAVSADVLKDADTSDFDGFKLYSNDSIIGAVVWNYADNMIIYMEISLDGLAKGSGVSVDDILAELM